jgi:hypothetical protein
MLIEEIEGIIATAADIFTVYQAAVWLYKGVKKALRKLTYHGKHSKS